MGFARPAQAVCDHYGGSGYFLLHTMAYFNTAECLLIVERSGLKLSSLDGQGRGKVVRRALDLRRCQREEWRHGTQRRRLVGG